MDFKDVELLRLLQANSAQSYAQLGQAVGLSVSAINERIKKLNARGFIRRQVALLSPRRLGIDLCAFVQLLLDNVKAAPEFEKRVDELAEVQECHFITGEYSYLLKIRARSTEHLQEVIQTKIQSIPGVVRTHTLISLSSTKETPELALESADTASTASEDAK